MKTDIKDSRCSDIIVVFFKTSQSGINIDFSSSWLLHDKLEVSVSGAVLVPFM